ncbi:hypothetical protein ACQPWY_19440 [Pseudonocardia xinjiangensis]|uniref:hypothetical protein n=1 Tax=Pseudonocardia xinjiangensis TaxID=75289 RepID=UPI003D945A76
MCCCAIRTAAGGTTTPFHAAAQLLARAASHRRPGQYQLQAAILACHIEAQRWEDTDWAQIVVLYDMLLHVAPSPIIRLNRAIALRYLTGPDAALTELDTLAPALERHHLYHATRAELLRELGLPEQAQLANRRALELVTNPAQRKLLEQRIHQPGGAGF